MGTAPARSAGRASARTSDERHCPSGARASSATGGTLGTGSRRTLLGRVMTVDNTTAVETETHGVELTAAAALKAKALLDQEGRDDMHLRIAVQPGGCAGLRYQLFFDDRELDGDLFRDFNGLKVGVDRMSAPYLQGAVIDFVDSIEKQGFTIDNPNAGGSC